MAEPAEHVETARIAADHPALPGHFPGRPLVPGVVILDLVQAAARRRYGLGPLAGLPAVKFLAPLAPDTPFTIALAPRADGSLAFQVAADVPLAQGSLRFAP